MVPYDPRWATLFEQCKSALLQILGPEVLAVHHVGSTSVHGLCAKPVLDILVSIPELDRGVGLSEAFT